MSKTFKIELHEGAENVPRAARRLIFNSDFLKSAKLCTGDIVALSSGDNSSSDSKKVSLMNGLYCWPYTFTTVP